MIRVLYLVIAILAFIELYSLGVACLAKRLGEEDYKLCFIPFYAFYVVNRITGGFNVLTIPVKKYHGMMAIVAVLSVFATLYACWGDSRLPAESAPSLWQIMGVVLVLCALLFWLSIFNSSTKIYRRFNVKRDKLALLLTAFVITVPVLYAYYAKKNEPRALKDMY
ncbi:MAG: hypothetical protein IJ514_04050 [Clostridia bacterium]|nr:hypothetical protein [Clostridia bacterium]